jgi:hypothetical protein
VLIYVSTPTFEWGAGQDACEEGYEEHNPRDFKLPLPAAGLVCKQLLNTLYITVQSWR